MLIGRINDTSMEYDSAHAVPRTQHQYTYDSGDHMPSPIQKYKISIHYNKIGIFKTAPEIYIYTSLLSIIHHLIAARGSRH